MRPRRLFYADAARCIAVRPVGYLDRTTRLPKSLGLSSTFGGLTTIKGQGICRAAFSSMALRVQAIEGTISQSNYCFGRDRCASTGRGGIGNEDGFSGFPPQPTKWQPSPYPARAGLTSNQKRWRIMLPLGSRSLPIAP